MREVRVRGVQVRGGYGEGARVRTDLCEGDRVRGFG